MKIIRPPQLKVKPLTHNTVSREEVLTLSSSGEDHEEDGDANYPSGQIGN